MGIPANACWLNSLANQEVYILNHQNIIYEHTMKLKCEMCPQDATFVVGCGNKTACSRCVTTRKCNPSRERAIEITQQDAKEMPCDICKSNPVSVVCLEDRAFLCTDCDLKIHSANDFAGHHQRFAFTNAKMALPEGVSKEKPEVPEHVPIAIRTNKRKNTARNNNTENNNNDNKIASSEEEQYFFDEDCHVVPEYVPGELIEANDVNSELYSSVNTGVELFSTTTNTANVYVPSVKSQKGSSFEDFLGEFIGFEETIDDAIVPTF